ncbi:MAG: CFI-box-CTERM domain-containing protein [Nitrosopumilaceae archaeon]
MNQLNKISKSRKMLALLAGLLIFYPAISYAQSSNGSIEVNAVYINGDRLATPGLVVKVFQDYSDTPFRIIDALPSSQFGISDLPLKHDYRVEIYQYGLFLGEESIFTKNVDEKLLIVIQVPKGVLFNVFYNDGQTPIKDAMVRVSSFEGVFVGDSLTDSDGKTSRFWLPPTRTNEYYSANVTLGEDLSYNFSDLPVVHGAPGEVRIVTPWPSVINNLITVQLYESPSEKSSASKERFMVELYDSKNNKIAESKVTDKGQAFFSKIKVDTYTFHVLQEGMLNNTKWEPLEVIIDGTQQEIKITKTVILPPLEEVVVPEITPTENISNQTQTTDKINGCNCVAFRLDDVQDYYLNASQIAVMEKFQEKNAGLTIGIIGSVIGSDEELISTIKSLQLDPDHILSIANQGWSGDLLTSFSKFDQERQILKSNEQIKSVFGVTPTVFFPPSNAFNDDTITVLKNNDFTHFSAFGVIDPPPYPLANSTFYRFPSYTLTGQYDADAGNWLPNDITKVKESIQRSLVEHGFAIVLMHPYEFSIFDGETYTGEVNEDAIESLGILLDDLRSDKLKIVKINQINFASADSNLDSDMPKPSTGKPKPIINDTQIPDSGIVIEKPENSDSKTNGCLIATATYGSELSPQVQTLREIRDQMLMKTDSGRSFMISFNQFYYSFSPTVADWERSNPVLKDLVKIIITPLIGTLSILTYLDIDSEAEMITYGVMLISLNLGIYFALPTLLIFKINEKIKTRKLKEFSQIN